MTDTCRHCSRQIVYEEGYWVDPEATGDDSIWRETCDANDTFEARHEPQDRAVSDDDTLDEMVELDAQMQDQIIEGIVSAGHGEYVLALPIDEFNPIWEPYGDDLFPRLDKAVGQDAVMAIWRDHTGLQDVPGDWDIEWENICKLRARRADLEKAMDKLLADLREDPGGDDGTFDYWPSGVRMALEVAAYLDENDPGEPLPMDWTGKVGQQAREFILTQRSEYAGELLQKTGLWQEGDPE